ncbi:MAG TPA: peptidase [Nitrosarchaeum sp.]|nr:peptidase [Nitrosarchaeum sp.]
MKALFLVLVISSIMILGSYSIPSAMAQVQAGGVELPGDPTWFAGEGLKKGDFFSYSLCHVNYRECVPFEMDLWIKGDVKTGSEDKWLVDVVVYDGNKIIKGNMEIGKLAPEPSGGTDNLLVYRSAFKSSIVWLSAFANGYDESGDKGPKKFSAKSWGKIGNIGGEQVVPFAIEKVTVRAGTFDTVDISWKTGGVRSHVYVVDNFPFPVKAHTYTHVSSGIPPTEYEFELLEYKQNVVNDPFANVDSTDNASDVKGCPSTDALNKSVKKPTKNFEYQIHAYYSPDFPVEGCPMKWQINFLSKFHDTEFLNQVQFDLMVVDDKFTLPPLRSVAQDQGYDYLYSPSGQATIDMTVNHKPGIAHFVVYVYGLSPQGIVPSNPIDYLVIDLPISAKTSGSTTSNIPSWIKNNAGWWADGSIDDNSFVQGIQFLIKENIIKIPPTSQGTSSTAKQIPSWIKNNAGWWADGLIDDKSFIEGLQFLIKEGIMKIPREASTSSSSSSGPASWLD